MAALAMVRPTGTPRRHKKISLKGLADFMTASSSRQRTIVREFKYPTEDEAHAKILYYREARDRIAAHHRSRHKVEWLDEQAGHLESLASISTGGTRTRLNHNGRALRAYARHFAKRDYAVLEDLTLGLQHDGVSVSVYPDLHVQEDGASKIIKLDFGVKEPDEEAVRIISQAMFEAAQTGGLGLPSTGVLYLDVARGRTHRGARMGARTRRDIEAACSTISAIWDSI